MSWLNRCLALVGHVEATSHSALAYHNQSFRVGAACIKRIQGHRLIWYPRRQENKSRTRLIELHGHPCSCPPLATKPQTNVDPGGFAHVQWHTIQNKSVRIYCHVSIAQHQGSFLLRHVRSPKQTGRLVGVITAQCSLTSSNRPGP